MAKKAAKKTQPKKTASSAEVPTVSVKADIPTNAETSPTAEQQAQIDAVKKAADAEVAKATAAILGGGTEAKVGTPSGNIEERQDTKQADFLPGTRRKDKTYVPEWIYDDRDGRKRKALDYNRFRYCMATEDDFHSYTLAGWKFCKFDGGSLSGLAEDGFQGTGDSVFMRDIRGYCRRGDVFLMYTEIRRYEEIKAEDHAANERGMKAPIGEFANVAYGKGVRAMAEINGEDVVGN